MRGFQGYIATASVVGSVFGILHGHQHRKTRLGAEMPFSISLSARDALVGAVLAPIAIPFLGLSAFFPAMNRCPFPPKES